VTASRREHGANRVTARKRRGFLPRLLANFGDPMIKILLIAMAINLLFLFNTADWVETAGIAAAVLLAVGISTASEMGSEAAFRKLQEEASRLRCRVRRREGAAEIPAEEVVVGDLMLLQAGDRVPADGMMLKGELDIDQSALNGETKEAHKTVNNGHIAANSEQPKDEKNLSDPRRVFSGTVVCGGEGTARVTAVGDSAVYGQLAGEVQEEKSASPLKVRLGGLAKTISRFGYAGAALAAFAYLFNVLVIANGFRPSDIFGALTDPAHIAEKLLHAATLAVTVIVVAVPEGLPMMITVVLSSNMRRMLRDNVLVRKPVGIETAGSLNILFTDKTGTLTRGKLQVTGFIDALGNEYTPVSAVYGSPLWHDLHRALVYNNGAVMSRGKPVGGNATDRVLLAFSALRPVEHRLTIGKTVPFNSERKTMSAEVSGEFSGTLLKGAPETVLPRCAGADRFAIEKTMTRWQKEGGRLIAVAEGRRLLGVFCVRDDVRPEAASGVRQLQDAGIQVVMITGDAKATAEAIARRVGLLGKDALALTSAELAGMSDEEVRAAIPRLRVVARALPGDKSRLVRIAQQSGLVTGMTGDGVNDAPALKRADVGFAMGSGTEVAKEAGDIVILDDNLLSITKAVRYGRTVFKSIRKFIIFQLTLNFSALGLSVAAPFIGVETPITVIQMLWINMVMDTLAGLAFGGEQALFEYMREPPKARAEPIINRYMWREITLGALYTVALCLWFLKSPVTAELFGEASFMTAFFALFMYTGIFTGLTARTHKFNLFDRLAGNKPFLSIMGLVAAAQTAMIYFGGAAFRTAGLSLYQLTFVLFLSSTAIAAHLIRTIIYDRRGALTGT
jgi:magnesium-transporting ATPase (P-type)